MKIIDKFIEYLYMPICRNYVRYILNDKPADIVVRSLCVPYFLYLHHYWPRFNPPRSFSEKIFHRMFYNRDPLLTQISDKLCVRDYVAQKVGADYLVPLLWHGNNPEDIPFNNLPKKFALKTNHGCGYNIIVQDKTNLDVDLTKRQLYNWLNKNFCTESFLGLPWAYKNIKPTIIIEALVDDNGKLPLDYKFFCYSGSAEYLLMTFDRFGDLEEKHFDRHYKPLNLWNGAPQHEKKIEKPINYEEMLRLADTLSQDFDFIRVDLYSVGERIYFGELTCYPAGGMARFIPKEYDFVFGEKWNLK